MKKIVLILLVILGGSKNSVAQPLGTIMAYSLDAYLNRTELISHGWRVCDGSSIISSDCGTATFFIQLGRIYGKPDDSSAYLPDLRGLFLRGVAEGGAQRPQPDLVKGAKENRKKPFHSNLASDYSLVGSTQFDAIQNHQHWQNIFRYFEETNVAGMNRATQANIYGALDYTDKSGAGTGAQGIVRTDEVWSATTNKPGWDVSENHVHLSLLETRPKNAAVYWLIKVK